METNQATLKRLDNTKTYLVLKIDSQELEIILTDDNPNNVKDVFNKLLIELKKGLFEFKLKDDTQDLYYHISQEYIKQLNIELLSIYNELKDYELIED